MPTPPGTFSTGPVSPQQLNADMYSYDGTGFGRNGVEWHSRKPILLDVILAPITPPSFSSSTAGTWSNMTSVGGYNVVDNSVFSGLGADYPGSYSDIQFVPQAISGAGSEGTYGGWYLSFISVALTAASASTAAMGAGVYHGGAFFAPGTVQRQFSSDPGVAIYLDLVNVGGNTSAWTGGILVAQESTVTKMPLYVVDNNDNSGKQSRFEWIWAAVSAGGGTVGSVPAPVTSWGTVTSANLNSGVQSCFTFLNNPPFLRAEQALQTSTASGVATEIIWGTAATITDNYDGYSTSTGKYTVPLSGLYLAFPTLSFGSPTNNGTRTVGVAVNGTSTTCYGGNMAGIGLALPTCVTQVSVLDLSAGDTVAVNALQDSGGAITLGGGFTLGGKSRFGLLYLCPLTPAGQLLNYSPPVLGYRWQAGMASGTALTALLNAHLGSDLEFLINRPYFTGVQNTAQTGFSDGLPYHITIDTPGGIIHGSNGDNYGGWNTANSWYVAPVAGWYLVIFTGWATPPTTTAGSLSAAIVAPTSGGLPPENAPDYYHEHFYPNTTDHPAATAVGLYYLLEGEYIYPELGASNWLTSGTWGTYVSSTVYRSQFTVIWVSE
jgi:hypothetical protein